jgi:hypothetical protein
MMLVVSVNPIAAVVIRPARVLRSGIRIATVVAVIAPGIITIIVSRVSVVAVSVRGVTESDSHSSDPD